MQIVSPRPAQTAPMNPLELPDLAAWYDSLDPITMLASDGNIVTDGGTVALWKDKSGNSGVNALVSPGANTSANSATLGAIGALGTGDFTVVARVSISSFASGSDVLLVGIGNGANAANLIAKNGTSRVQMSKATVGYVSATSGSNLSAFTAYTVAYTKSGTTGTYYINGIADGTCTDSFDYTANSGVSVGQFFTAVSGAVYQVRIYSVALDAAGVLADYNGTVQANNTINIDFTTAPTKLANLDTFVCTTGQTVTLNSSGATGARIAGGRDLFQGTAANRPVLLKYEGTKYGYSNGVSGNNFSTPDANALDITGPIDIDFDAALANWASATQSAIVKAGSYGLQVFSSGAPRLIWVDSGGVVRTRTATTTTGFSAGQRGRVRGTLVPATGEIKFFTSSDGVSWTQLGATITFGATSIKSDVGALTVMSSGASETVTGNMYRARVYDGIRESGGTLVADFNPALYTSGTTFTASTGEVWTVNGGATIVTRTCNYGDGSNDSLKSAAYSCAQPTTVYWVGTMESWTASDYLFDGNATNGGALVQTTSTPQVNLNAGSSVAANTGAPLKTWGVFCAVLNGASSTLRWVRLPATTGDAGAGNMNGMTLLARGAADAGWFNGCVGEVAQYSGAHNIATQDRWAIYAGRKRGFAV